MEARERDRRKTRLRAARDHHVRIATLDRVKRVADRVIAAGAGRHRSVVRSRCARTHRYLPCGQVDDAGRDEKRRDTARPTAFHQVAGLHDRDQPSHPGADDHPCLVGIRQQREPVKSGVPQRLVRGDQRILDKRIHPPRLSTVQHALGRKILYLRRDAQLRRKILEDAASKWARTGPTRADIGPGLRSGVPECGDHSDSSDYDTTSQADPPDLFFTILPSEAPFAGQSGPARSGGAAPVFP